MAESKRGKLGAEKRRKANAPQNPKGGRDYTVTLSENLKFSEPEQRTIHTSGGRIVKGHVIVKTVETSSTPFGIFSSGKTSRIRQDEYRRQLEARRQRQSQVRQENKRIQGLKFKDELSVTLNRGARQKQDNNFLYFDTIGEASAPPLSKKSSVDDRQKLRLSGPRAGLLYGAESIARLRKDTEEQRRKRDPLTQATVGFAEGVGNTAFAVGSIPITAAKDVRGVFEGKPFGAGSKDFVESVQSEFRPSALSQLISQLNPDPSQRESPQFDITGISRSAGEVVPFLTGSRSTSVKIPKQTERVVKNAGKFEKETINLGKSPVFKEGPFFNPASPQNIARFNLGQGIGKTKLRQGPRRNPFLDDTATKESGKNVFGSQGVGLGSGASKIIERSVKQTQKTGQQTIQKTKTIPNELDILRQKPRFKETKQSGITTEFESITLPKGSPRLTPRGSQRGKLGSPQREIIKFQPLAIPSLSPRTSSKQQPKTRSPQRLFTSTPFRFSETTGYRLTTTPKLGTPFQQIQTPVFPNPPRSPPLQPPKTPIRPITGFGPFGRPISLSAFSGGSQGSTKNVYGAFGISENINIGRLPGPLSEFSTSSKVFTRLDKRDKAFQDAIFGKPRTKSKKVKGKKRKRK